MESRLARARSLLTDPWMDSTTLMECMSLPEVFGIVVSELALTELEFIKMLTPKLAKG